MQGNTTEIDERNLLRLDALLSHGYGLSPQLVMRSKGLSMQRSGARARIKGEVFLPVFTEHAEEKVAERCADTLDGQAQERHRMPMPRIGPVPDPRGNFPFSKKAGAD